MNSGLMSFCLNFQPERRPRRHLLRPHRPHVLRGVLEETGEAGARVPGNLQKIPDDARKVFIIVAMCFLPGNNGTVRNVAL